MTRVYQKARYFGQQRLQTVQNLDVLCLEGVFFLSTSLRVSRQGIGSSVSLALTIINSKVLTREFLSPADLPGAQTLRVHESSKVDIVGKHENFMSRAL